MEALSRVSSALTETKAIPLVSDKLMKYLSL